MKKRRTAQAAFFSLRVLVAVFVCSEAAYTVWRRVLLAFLDPVTYTNGSHRTLTFAERECFCCLSFICSDILMGHTKY
jgi:H+/Cl- antiporter ClcA